MVLITARFVGEKGAAIRVSSASNSHCRMLHTSSLIVPTKGYWLTCGRTKPKRVERLVRIQNP
jgi:hypothetical protein